MTSRALIFSLVLSGTLAGPAFADDRGSDADQEACTPDVFRLCSDFIPDEAPIVACLKSKETQLSPACHQVFFSAPPTTQPAAADVRHNPHPHRSSRSRHHHRHHHVMS